MRFVLSVVEVALGGVVVLSVVPSLAPLSAAAAAAAVVVVVDLVNLLFSGVVELFHVPFGLVHSKDLSWIAVGCQMILVGAAHHHCVVVVVGGQFSSFCCKEIPTRHSTMFEWWAHPDR